VDDVRITASLIDGSERVLERSPGLRDARGVLHISLPAGQYRVDATSVKRRRNLVYEPASMEVEIEHGEPSKTAEMILRSTERFRVSGRVFGLDPAVAGAMVLVLAPKTDERIQTETQPRRGAPLEKSGRFVVNDVPRGSYRIELTRAENNALPASGDSYPLGDIAVHANLRGLLFPAPPGTGEK
jgi:hypothetical protein